MKAPPGSPLCDYAWRVCQTKDPQRIKWGETGPMLIAEAVKRLSFERYVASCDTFCPLHPNSWREMFDPSIAHVFGEESFAAHLWNEKWRYDGLDKDASYPRAVYTKNSRNAI